MFTRFILYLWITLQINCLLGQGAQRIFHFGSYLQTRIVHGKNAEAPERYPYVASIVVTEQNKVICGAAIVNTHHLVTAAHCFDHFNKDSLHIVTGTVDLGDKRKIKREIESVAIHEEYSKEIPMGYNERQTYVHDIAVIEVTEPFYFNKKVKSVGLPTKEVEQGAKCIITGHGIANYRGVVNNIYQPTNPHPLRVEHPNRLQVATLSVNDPNTCLRISNMFMEESMICAGDPTGFGPSVCVGDYGSALVCNNELQGIASFKSDSICKNIVQTPGYFTKVSNYIEWLKDKGIHIDDDYYYEY